MALDLSHVNRALADSGYVYLAEVPAGFDYPDELSRLGPFVPQYSGELIRDIRPDSNLARGMISADGFTDLRPHTEWYEFPGLPPRYVALWCVRPCLDEGGETTIADGYRLLELFSAGERERLAKELRSWRSHPTVGVERVARHPILEQHDGVLILRFSTLDLSIDDELTARYIEAGVEFFEKERFAIKMRRGSLLVWDNWRMIHARNSFTDPGRHLRRVLIAAA